LTKNIAFRSSLNSSRSHAMLTVSRKTRVPRLVKDISRKADNRSLYNVFSVMRP